MKASFLPASVRYLCIAIVVAIPAARSFAQHTSTKIYNINDGLQSSEIGSAYQDNYGYLWFFTATGLSRFDGRQFVNYSIADGLPSLAVSGFFQDSRERLWVGTTAGIAQFKNNRFITYPTSDKKYDNYFFDILETSNKRIWALSLTGIYEFAGSIWNKISLCPGFENTGCRNIVETDGELYVNYSEDIVCRNKEGKWRTIASKGFFNVMSLQDNHILVSTSENIYEIREHQLIPLFKNGMQTPGNFSYLVDSKKRLWVAGQNFLKISRPGDWRHFSDSINQYKNYHFLKEDLNHNVWTSSIEGLMKIKDIEFTIIDKNNVIPLDGIYNIIPLPGNKLILSSGTKSGLLLYANNSFIPIPPPQSDKKNYLRDPVDAYTFDEKNTLWLVTRFKRFLHFDGKNLEDHSNALNLKTHEHIYDMSYIKSRAQFFVCADSTLLFGSSSKLSTFIPKNTGVPIVKPTRIFEIKNGLLLLYIDRLGVYCLDSTNNLISLVRETGIDGSKKGVQLAVRFYEDTDNSFWIAVPGLGLYEFGFKKGKLPFFRNHFSVKDGLQSNNIHSLTSDLQNRIWVATSSGLDILQKNSAGKWEVFNYGTPEDLTITTNSLEKLISDTNGNIWLSSPNRIIKFNPGNIQLHKEPPHVIIEKVTLAFKETNWSKLADSLYSYYDLPYHPVLRYDQNSLGIFFNAIDLSTSSSNPEYTYKLLPLDTSWSTPSTIKSVSFAQLPAGTYRFLVKTKDLASGWSKPAIFVFTIKQPFWNEWWFRIIIISLAAFIIISIFRNRIKKIRDDALIENQLKELEMKALKAQMNPHFIYNALNSIQALVANDKKKEGIHYIGSFSRLLRGVLNNSENNVISLDKELETVDLYIQLESLRLDMQLHYKKNIDQNIVTEFEKIPPLVLQPFIENAIWHGLSQKQGEKEIKINISLTDEWLICEITDNGIGREKAKELKNNSTVIHQSKAIDITRKRLVDFNEDDSVPAIGFLDLYDRSQTPEGTRVILHIKRKKS